MQNIDVPDGTLQNIDNYVGTLQNIDNHVGTLQNIDNYVGTLQNIDNYVGTLQNIDNYVGTLQNIDNHVGTLHATSHQEHPILAEPDLSQLKDFSFDIAFSLHDLTIHDGQKKLIDAVSWTVKKGEKWALLGRNGAGKSMLLSVIFADHPQAYANHIVLFDRPRGSGESIWEIREQIGYFSPELFLYMDKEKTCRQLAAICMV